MVSWFQAVQTVGIIGGLILSGLAFRNAGRATRVANLLTITGAHREIWRSLNDNPDLEYVLREDADPDKLSPAQQRFLTELILHLSASFEAAQADALVPLEGLRRDVQGLFALPAPRAVWSELRDLQNERFRRFIDRVQGEDQPILPTPQSKRLCGWARAHIETLVMTTISIATVAVAVIAISDAEQGESRSYHQSQLAELQSQRQALSRLIAEIITLSHMRPLTTRVEQAELAAAEVALPLAKELRSSTTAVDFYEIGSAFLSADEIPHAREALKQAIYDNAAPRPRAYALRDEAGILYRLGGQANIAEAIHDIYLAEHAFNKLGSPTQIHIDHATTYLFAAAEARPIHCTKVKDEIRKARYLIKTYSIPVRGAIGALRHSADIIVSEHCK